MRYTKRLTMKEILALLACGQYRIDMDHRKLHGKGEEIPF